MCVNGVHLSKSINSDEEQVQFMISQSAELHGYAPSMVFYNVCLFMYGASVQLCMCAMEPMSQATLITPSSIVQSIIMDSSTGAA